MAWEAAANPVPRNDPMRLWYLDGSAAPVAGPVAGVASVPTIVNSSYGRTFYQLDSLHGNAAEAAAFYGDWTWEAFVYLVGSATHILFSSGGWANPTTEDGNVTSLIYITGSKLKTHWEHGANLAVTPSATSATALALGTWYHLAIVKDSVAKTLAYYVNGVADGTATFTFNSTGGDSATAGVCRTSIGGYVNFGHTTNCRIGATTFSTIKRDAAWIAASAAHRLTDGVLPTDGSTWIDTGAILLSGLEDDVNGPTLGQSTPSPAPPTITVVSPTPGVAPGQPGGFQSTWVDASVTPVVVEIDGADLTLACLVVRYPIDDNDEIERVVYRRGELRRGFEAASSVEQVTATKLRLTVLPNEGWPSRLSVTDIEFDVDAVAGGAISDEAASS